MKPVTKKSRNGSPPAPRLSSEKIAGLFFLDPPLKANDLSTPAKAHGTDPMTTEPRTRCLLAVDVGGTNLNQALVLEEKGRFTMLCRDSVSTQDQRALLEPLQAFLQHANTQRFPTPEAACISGAGPVQGKRIPLTNAPWDIDGEELEVALGLPVRVINDFAAVSYGVLLLDPQDPGQLLSLPHPDGHTPTPTEDGLKLVIGAGTGLGVGFITQQGGLPKVHPSEGGHIGLPLLDEESLALWSFLRERYPGPPGAEAIVSGRGIATLFQFLVDTRRIDRDACIASILALPETQRPAAISGHAATHVGCARVMARFVDLYARVAAELTAAFLPSGGLYLAGGIATKNCEAFLHGHRFMRSFEQNYRSHLDQLTRSTPVFIVRDYAISLFGAAHAASLPFQSV